MAIDRRDFLKLAGSGFASTLAGLAVPRAAHAKSASKARVIIVGAGYGGATCARYLRLWEPSIEVTLIDPHSHMVSCPMSNWVLGGLREMADLDKSYDGLRKRGVKMLQDSVTGVNPDKRTVSTAGGRTLAYDRLVLAPGVEFMTGKIEGYDAASSAGKVVHAFTAGPETALLRKQLEAMPDGGVFVIASPPPTGRCVSGPYERACLAAHYFKQHKPKSKIIMLDGHFKIISKDKMFQHAFETLYPGMIEHRPNNLVNHVNHETMTVSSDWETVKADVINIVPMQRAGKLCAIAGVRSDSDKRWCPVNFATYESKTVPNIHVIGDSVLANMPKSAHVSNNQGKITAAALIELFSERMPDPLPIIGSTSYSATSDHTAGPIAVVMRYDQEQDVYVRQPGGGGDSVGSELNFEYNKAWFASMWADTLGA